ncbi:MAG: hypothetical protein QOE83_14 [Actinomycetota bacterium]|nr:hypothetical protein [Actinomycetota bacterium]
MGRPCERCHVPKLTSRFLSTKARGQERIGCRVRSTIHAMAGDRSEASVPSTGVRIFLARRVALLIAATCIPIAAMVRPHVSLAARVFYFVLAACVLRFCCDGCLLRRLALRQSHADKNAGQD